MTTPLAELGRRAKAARILATTERIFNYRVRKYGIQVPEAEQRELFDIVGSTKVDIVLAK